MKQQVFRDRIETAGRKLVDRERQPSPGTNLLPAPEVTTKKIEQIQKQLQIPERFHHIGANLWATVTKLTPERALLWLTAFNSENRDPYPWQFEALKGDIETGAWSLTHQGLGFEIKDVEPVFRDGQHRAWAVLESGLEVLTMVVLNLPSTAMPVIDRHRSRRARDLLSFGGGRMTTFHESCIRRCMLGDKPHQSGAQSIPQIAAFLEAHRSRLEWAIQCFHGPRLPGVTVAPVVAAVFRASFHLTKPEARARLEDFVTALLQAKITDERDSAVIILRNALQNPYSRAKQTGEGTYLKVIRALDAFVRREPLARAYEASTDLFPLPKGAAPEHDGQAEG